MLGPVAWSPDRRLVALAVRPVGRVEVVGGPTVATATPHPPAPVGGAARVLGGRRRGDRDRRSGCREGRRPGAGQRARRGRAGGRLAARGAARGRLAIVSAAGASRVPRRAAAGSPARRPGDLGAQRLRGRPGRGPRDLAGERRPSRGGSRPCGRRRTIGRGARRPWSTRTGWRSRAVTSWPSITAAALARTGCASWIRAVGRCARSTAAPPHSAVPGARWCSTRAPMAKGARVRVAGVHGRWHLEGAHHERDARLAARTNVVWVSPCQTISRGAG